MVNPTYPRLTTLLHLWLFLVVCSHRSSCYGFLFANMDELPSVTTPDSTSPSTIAVPSVSVWPRNDFEGVNYLIRYGYLHPGYGWFLGSIVARDKLEAALQKFQRIAGIPVTGRLDEKSFSMMRRKRCGVPDMSYAQRRNLRSGLPPRRRKRFVMQGSKWNHQKITYKISKYPRNLSGPDVDSTLIRAFKVWNNLTSLHFTWMLHGLVDIDIRFLSSIHGDGMPFDGRNGVTAHTFFPNDNSQGVSGDIHFDADENWTLGTKTDPKSGKTSLFCEAVHQIGHSLGLFHSQNQAAYMWPYITECNSTTLPPDDMQALKSLYGHSDGSQTTIPGNGSVSRDETIDGDHSGAQISTTVSPQLTTSLSDRFWWTRKPFNRETRQTFPFWYRLSRSSSTATTPASKTLFHTTARPKYCDGRLDAITVATDHLTYGFRDELVFRFNQINVDYMFPKKVQEVFPGGPLSVDAAVTFSKNRKKAALGSTYLIKGNLVWRYRHTQEGFQLEHFYPKPWAKEWDVTGTKIESAFKLGRKVYLLIDSRIWLMKGKKSRKRKYHEKNKIKLFNQLPDFQAAVQWINRNTYFFTGSEYYRADMPAQRNRVVLTGPRDTAYWWFGCNEVPHIRQPFEDSNDNEWDLELNT